MNDTDLLGDATDRMLLRRMAASDREALTRLYRAYHGRLCRFLSRLTRRPDIIEEAINDCFWIVWQKAGDFRGDSQVSTWIMGIAYRCGLKAIRHHSDDAIDDGVAAEDHAAAADPDEDRELRDWLGKGLERLSADQRLVVELVYGLGHKLEEVAAIMQCPVGTIKARLFHARVKLRNVLPGLAGDASTLTESA
ncbi:MULTISPECIES: sigma-70 family RNA polymerase sigma factor [Xanthomonas]|uniref:Sigma-70 family RNA polymerase sigma factor n=3 Tax=Xanthomonas TaxID=338 RepID=A0A6N7QH19_9XANT|nr:MULTISPECIES: sigma-70 family RNA polymerase sigma factor [Xanthomonas]AJC44744.1 RNA polymerase sigma70 [Xanthomonas sacchari]KAA8921489.1 RNA polymerase subunit sigma-70 [Xanthomonas sontii]KAB7766507.1 RNA polymerase subunit sigma-70 [Xanthomonas sp. LMG 12461]KAB7772595.1 RNA polymerase subunit sigma-70 [Xanthomonas sp. LMG 12462]KAB7777801.1 RNA polymerase subunit sigma-70 [Xanthomonas sp. LMG 12460]